MIPTPLTGSQRRLARIPLGRATVWGMLEWPSHPSGIVVLAPDRTSGRLRWRTDLISEQLHADGLATLIAGLRGRNGVVDGVALEAEGLLGVLKWIGEQPETRELPVGLFGSGSGVVTALDAAAMNPNVVRALVCLDGRADLAADLAGVEAQTMLLVDGCDARLVALNRWALDRLRCPSRMLEIASASHLGQNAVEWATRWTSEWFVRCLALEPGWHQSAAPFAPGEQDHAGVAISS